MRIQTVSVSHTFLETGLFEGATDLSSETSNTDAAKALVRLKTLSFLVVFTIEFTTSASFYFFAFLYKNGWH